MNATPVEGCGTAVRAWNASRHLARVQSMLVRHLVPAGGRAVLVAPHPGAEVLAWGGLLQLLHREQRALLLISLSNGIPHGQALRSRWTPEQLAIIRPLETAEALQRLGVPAADLQWVHGGFSAGNLNLQDDALQTFLGTYLHADDVVFSTWREDGDADHEACGRSTAAACATVGARFHEVPLDAWRWASPEDPRLPWERARKLHLDRWAQARKRHAVQAFASQLHGGSPAFSAPALARLQQPFELVFL
ncbi:MAG: PIG-L family deacetylase [Gammaproteobacteria bacterium]|nr:PIG-L family deacetylase [Gammaproteobacteria bacterium]MBU1489550.1 PIG-L family deacetylase [Gammaproteobacteria bacterium]MBU2067831.1 PIG-L family deacetylase [Gammaproteobacteria bacterium]MBU2141014.1 PIG-L family deacetylase [Gammaproteobacteria bacterium]MBU2217355.1 PIG-L family deacetylase [Gammaproteobacteria bacterium]